MITRKKILKILDEVNDPEIPVLSLVDLGIINEIFIEEDNSVIIEMTPTFAGCPAIHVMKDEILEALNKHKINAKVNVSFKIPWNSNKITQKGREALQKFGLAPPPKHNIIFDIDILEDVECPNCKSQNTELKSPFGPTLCRSLHYCNNCHQAFEQFKPL
ncbi:MAG: phenylacetate-CoA oxygenase subunit PaaJ [Bacteroidota bacterium]|nr:phenylacetate-CoA oxygenase subunit PaaJ [Bacteroidota bacterium]